MSFQIVAGRPSGFVGRSPRRVRQAHVLPTFVAMLAMAMAAALVASPALAAGAASSGPVDLNRASVEQLEELPGIGSAKAALIVAERESNGGFASVEDLEAVRGIGPALLEKLKPLVTVGKGKSNKKAKR